MTEVVIEKIAMGAKPDPYKFEIIRLEYHYNHTIILARYEGCLTFDGLKLMLFEGIYNPIETLDPHFLDESYPLVARFQPTGKGWVLARQCACDNYDNKLDGYYV